MMDIEATQGSPNWVAARRGHLTASRMRDVLAVSKKDGKPLEARTRYMMELVAERVTGISTEHYVTAAMQWGLDHEAEARAAYEAYTGNVVREAGFILHPSIEWFGASPDGFVDDRMLIEIKCPSTVKFIEWVKAGVVPEEHKPQMLAQMACTGIKTCEFVAYDPRVQRGRNLFIARFDPIFGSIFGVEDAASAFLAEVDQMFTSFVQS
jgi:exodeoxyribonuclease (lambda-induced)